MPRVAVSHQEGRAKISETQESEDANESEDKTLDQNSKAEEIKDLSDKMATIKKDEDNQGEEESSHGPRRTNRRRTQTKLYKAEEQIGYIKMKANDIGETEEPTKIEEEDKPPARITRTRSRSNAAIATAADVKQDVEQGKLLEPERQKDEDTKDEIKAEDNEIKARAY